MIDLKDVRHPCLTDRTAASVVVPNDVKLGFESSRAMLITGPNMGGKSTLMRSTCLAGRCMRCAFNVDLWLLVLTRPFSDSSPHGRVCAVQFSQVKRATHFLPATDKP